MFILILMFCKFFIILIAKHDITQNIIILCFGKIEWKTKIVLRDKSLPIFLSMTIMYYIERLKEIWEEILDFSAGLSGRVTKALISLNGKLKF